MVESVDPSSSNAISSSELATDLQVKVICAIKSSRLPSIDDITTEHFSDGKSGAVASFAGLTRDNFQGKRVT